VKEQPPTHDANDDGTAAAQVPPDVRRLPVERTAAASILNRKLLRSHLSAHLWQSPDLLLQA
jgi:hypothetical protein